MFSLIDCPETDHEKDLAEVTYSDEVILTPEEIDEIIDGIRRVPLQGE